MKCLLAADFELVGFHIVPFRVPSEMRLWFSILFARYATPHNTEVRTYSRAASIAGAAAVCLTLSGTGSHAHCATARILRHRELNVPGRLGRQAVRQGFTQFFQALSLFTHEIKMRGIQEKPPSF
jgi:hypothetical protein